MDFFNSAVEVLQTIVVGLGRRTLRMGRVNLLEGYGQDNPASKSQGVKQLVAGGRCCPDRHYPCPPAVRAAGLIPRKPQP